MSFAPTVALLGGESSGKTQLGLELQRRLLDHGIAALLVPDLWREWSMANGRAPRADELAAIASAQTRRIEAAARALGTVVVIADTTALAAAVELERRFQDTSFMACALAAQKTYPLTLLMGLDLPGACETTDALLRSALHAGGIGFQTVYGHGQARAHQALRALGRVLGRTLTRVDPEHATGRRPWGCEHCSDPDCERRLFSGLLPSP